MTLCLPCPLCSSTLIYVIDGDIVWIKCPTHGEFARGASLEQAIKHSNIFVQGLITQASEVMRNPLETPAERTIRLAKFGIAPNEDER